MAKESLIIYRFIMAKVLVTDLTFAIQASTDLANWVISDPFTMASEISNGDGKTAISIWRSNAPVTSSGIKYPKGADQFDHCKLP